MSTDIDNDWLADVHSVNSCDPPQPSYLWNEQLLRVVGVDIVLHVLQHANKIAQLGNLMGKPIKSIVPVKTRLHLPNDFPNIQVEGDGSWGAKFLEKSVHSNLIHLSTPKQIQYLLGRRDFTVSHCTTSIHLDAVRAFLCEHFQSLMFVFIFQCFLATD